MEEVVEGYNFKVIARSGLFKPSFNGETLITPWKLLELDATMGLLGDSLAGILLAPIREATPRVSKLVEVYRSRVIAEESSWVKEILGSLSKVTLVKPELYPLLRMMRVQRYCRVYVEALQDLGLEALSYARSLASTHARYTSATLLSLPPLQGFTCSDIKPPHPQVDLKLLIAIPEGYLDVGILGYELLVQRHLGEPVSCSRVSILYSVMTCRGPRGVIAVKDYTMSSFKWIPAFLASSLASRFQRDPRDRAVTELVYSKLLRGIVRTPRTIALHVRDGRVVSLREYIDGYPLLSLDNPVYWGVVGGILARIHSSGYSLGDANPSNFLVTPSDVALIDLEQARRANVERMAWDLITVIAYSHLMNINSKLIEELLEGYASEIGELKTKVGEELLKPRYWIPYTLIPFRLPEALNMVRRVFS